MMKVFRLEEVFAPIRHIHTLPGEVLKPLYGVTYLKPKPKKPENQPSSAQEMGQGEPKPGNSHDSDGQYQNFLLFFRLGATIV